MNILMIYRMKRYYEEIEPKLAEYAGNNITVICEKHVEALGLRYFDKEGAINNIYLVNELLEGKLDAMQFDYIVGNPPYQNKASDSDAGKLYLNITRKVLDLLTPSGVISFITPTTLAQEKRTGLTLKGMSGLKEINYTTNKDFNVGVEVMSWTIDKKYVGPVKVIEDYDENFREIGETLVKEKDKVGFNFFERMKSFDSRMFINVQTGQKKQAKKNDKFKYKIIVNRFKDTVEYTSIKPRLFGENKLVISISRDISNDNLYISDDNFLGVQTSVENMTETEIDNLKNFLMLDMVNLICKKYKEIFKTGFNNILRFFPKIDVSKSYTDEDVIELFKITKEELEWLND